MNLSLYIAQRISSNKKATFSRFIIKLATIATALSVAVMIIAVSVVQGFQHTIEKKMFVFWGQIQVAPFSPDLGSVIGNEPIDNDSLLLKHLRQVPGVQQVYPYLLKPVIINAGGQMEGLKIKGIDASYPLNDQNAITFSGKPIHFPEDTYSQDIILSQTTLDRLNKKVGDQVLAFFFNPGQATPPIRKLTIVGAYHTGMNDIDRNFALCDMRLLQRVSNYDGNKISAYQVSLRDYKQSASIAAVIHDRLLQPPLTATAMQEVYPEIFNWLSILNVNAILLLVIMAVVASVNLATALLIFILERTPMIGILKSMGMTNGGIQRIFLVHAVKVSLKGVLLGNIIGVALCLLQQYGHIIHLDETSYYMKYVPAEINGWFLLLIDAGTIIFCTIIMLIPSILARSIKIVKTLQY